MEDTRKFAVARDAVKVGLHHTKTKARPVYDYSEHGCAIMYAVNDLGGHVVQAVFAHELLLIASGTLLTGLVLIVIGKMVEPFL